MIVFILMCDCDYVILIFFYLINCIRILVVEVKVNFVISGGDMNGI